LAYAGLDQLGWIPHSHDTPVWIEGDWLVGEYRDCQMRTKTARLGESSWGSIERLPRLFCGQDASGIDDFEHAVYPSSSLQHLDDPSHETILPLSVTLPDFDKYLHLLPVRYFGRIDRSDRLFISWHCQRLSESLECKALN
jgi:hypothetical protein